MPVRRGALLNNIWDSRAEGMATGKAKDAIFAELGPLAAMARQLYDPADARDAAAIEVEMIGDRLMLETTRSFAAMMSPRQPVWQYRFDYVAQAMADDSPSRTAPRSPKLNPCAVTGCIPTAASPASR